MKRIKNVLVFAGSMVAVAAANAQTAAPGIDVTAVTAGVSDAQTAILNVIQALIGLSVAIFGVSKVYAFIKRRSGA